ncbi:MAG: cysteine--tRNA ligase [Pirellulaceae bacterium]|nr:MAG: cysteine--tRNA ligase [Pirellulaceae bacterium]
MEITFYNTLTKKIERFEPLQPPVVTMYGCGPTVYDYAHIGNFRAFLFADLVRRFLEFMGYQVRQVMNITDVGHMTEDQVADGAGEDKMQVAARKLKEAKKAGLPEVGAVENPDDPYQVAAFFTNAFLEDARRLGLKVAFEYPENVVHATQHIAQMQQLIERLLQTGHAYVADDGVVYYSVESFPEYGRLSGNSLDNLREGSGGRILAEDQAFKRHPADFMLWKPDPHHIMKWDSPWGTGYPGWHIECSAMAMYKLGETIDIHTGGEDLIFPHHECEIAQSCGATGKPFFARYWLHVRFLLVEGEKMSKRLGNFYTVRDVLSGKATGRPVHPAVLRYELIKSHYRTNMNFTAKGLIDSAGCVLRLNRFVQQLEEQTGGEEAPVDQSHPILEKFAQALADDLNIAAALGVVLPWTNQKIRDARESLAVMRRINRVLGVAPLEPTSFATPVLEFGIVRDPQVLEICRQIDEARAAKDYARADQLRQQLLDAGYQVQTTRDGTVVQQQLA